MPRSKKAKQWNSSDMEAAMTAVASGMKKSVAAETFNVPRTTLLDRIAGRVEHGSRSGPETILTENQEKQLSAYLISMSKQGYGKSKEVIIFMATSIAKRNGKLVKGGSLSKKWWKGFLRRHPEISMRSTENFGLVRTLVNRTSIEIFYQRLLDALTTKGSLLENPAQIFNCDESGFEFDAINKIAASARGARHVPRISKGQHEKVTVLACASAAGSTIPPLFIFKNKSGRVPPSVRDDAPPGTLFCAQKSGWIDKDIYLKWFHELFIPNCPQQRPVLLIVDGHKSHVTEDLINAAIANQVVVFCLPAHASHLLQPLDLSLFGPLKKGWVKACAAFNHMSSIVVSQRNFAKIFNLAWQTSVTPEIIRSGFRKPGIYPYDPKMFDYDKLAPSVTSQSSTMGSTTSSVDPPVVLPQPPPLASTPIHQDSHCLETSLVDVQVDQPPPPPLVSTPIQNSKTSSSVDSPVMPSYPSIGRVEASLHLCQLEQLLNKETRDQFRRRFDNGYNLNDDSLYNTWKEVYIQAGGTLDDSICPCNGACCCTCKGKGYCDCIASNIQLHTPKPPNLPSNNVQISTPTGPINLDPDLLDIMILPQKQVARKRKHNNVLDPGNKCITGKKFLEAIQSERERKEKEEKEKEKARLEKKKKAEEKKEEKAKKAEERKVLREKKAEEKRLAAENKKKEKHKKRKKRKTIIDVYEEKISYTCTKCLKEYNENEDIVWVECDYCSEWLHYLCTDLPVLGDVNDDIAYTCDSCIREGFPSHQMY